MKPLTFQRGDTPAPRQRRVSRTTRSPRRQLGSLRRLCHRASGQALPGRAGTAGEGA